MSGRALRCGCPPWRSPPQVKPCIIETVDNHVKGNPGEDDKNKDASSSTNQTSVETAGGEGKAATDTESNK